MSSYLGDVRDEDTFFVMLYEEVLRVVLLRVVQNDEKFPVQRYDETFLAVR